MGQSSRKRWVPADAAHRVRVRIASRTDVGLVRANNEDALVLGDLANGKPSLEDGRIGAAGILFGVCDGMGGAAAGEVASRLAARTILKEMARTEITVSEEGFEKALSAAVTRAGQVIRDDVAVHPERSGMGTTATVAAVRAGFMVIAHVGDSRAYLWREGNFKPLTTDQNWANEMLALGRVSPEHAAEMENGKAIVQAVGRTEELEVAIVRLDVCDGDKVLICSDGLSGMVADNEIARVVGASKNLDSACDELLRLAKNGGGQDNISFVLCEFSGSALTEAGGAEDGYRVPTKPMAKPVLVAAVLLLGGALSVWLLRGDASGSATHAAPVSAHKAAALPSSQVHDRESTTLRQSTEVPTSDVSRRQTSEAALGAVAPARPASPAIEENPRRPRAASGRNVQQPARSLPGADAPPKVEVIRTVDPMAGNPF